MARPVSKVGSTKKLVQSEVKVGLYNTLAFLHEAALSSQLDIFNRLIGGVKDAISQVESGQSKPTESNLKRVAASGLGTSLWSKIAAAKAPQTKNPTIQPIAAKGNY